MTGGRASYWIEIYFHFDKKIKYMLSNNVIINMKITEEERLKRLELRYRRLFETAQDGILLIDFNTGIILDVNKFLIDLLGFSKADFLEKHLWDVGIFKDIAASKGNFRILQNKGYIRFEDLPFETKSGKKINVEFISNVYEVGDTKVIQCNIRDITERRWLEKESLQAKEEEFRAIFDKAADGILLADMKSKKFLIGNNAICHMLGYNEEEIKNLGVMDIHPKKDIPYVIDQFGRQAKGEFSLSRDLPIKRKDGSVFYADVNATTIDINKKLYLVGFFHDTTERKNIEEKLKKSEEGLLSKINELEKFIKLTVDRELKMVELKKEVKELEEKLNKK